MLPQRRKRERSGMRDNDGPIRSPGHLQFVRGFVCSAQDTECAGKIEAAHVRLGSHAGLSQKPGDHKVVPLCAAHHSEQHEQVEATFWKSRGKDPHRIADQLWQASKHRLKFEAVSGAKNKGNQI